MRIQSFLRQCLGTTIMAFPKFLLGSGTVWPSYALLILQSAATPLSGSISLFEEALMGSLPYVSSIFMSPFGGVIVDKIGRRWSGILTNAIVAVSWIFVIYGTTSPMLLVGRCLFGVSGGLLMQVAWAFAAEVSEDACRGFMSSMPSVMYALGALVSIILGWVTTYHNIAYINFGLAIVNAFTMWLLPETPVYLCLIGKHEEALKSLSFYRASTTKDKAVLDEMAAIKANQDSKKTAALVPTEGISPGARWSFIVVTVIMTLSIFTGVIAIQVYGGTLFLKATPSLSPDLCAVLLATILMLGAISGAACTDLFGRRILLMSAATVNGVCMVLLGVMVRWPFGPEWLVPAVILVFCFIFNFGGGMIPYVLLAEVFVPEVKGFSQSIMMLWLYIVNFILLLVFVPAVEFIGLQIVFFVFAGCAFACTLCTYYMIPETKGMNPYAIEEMFAMRIKDGRQWARPITEKKLAFPKFLLGSGTVWPSYALLILQSAATPLSGSISLFEEALMGSLPYVSSIFMSPFGGVIVDKIGRRWSGILTNAIVAVSWIFVIYGTTSPMLLVGRCLFGVSGGLLMQVAWAFAAEVSEDACRGFMSSMPSVMYALGALVSIILGWVTTYHNIAYINFGLAIVNAFTMWLLPETPVYLCLIGKHEEALKSLSFYRASTTKDKAVLDEMAAIKANQDSKKTAALVPTEEPATQDPEKQNLANEEFVPAVQPSALQYFRISPGARWSFIVVTVIMTLSIFTGVIAIQVYGGTLFLKATPSLSPDLCAVLLATILMLGAISGAACTDLFGRRILLMSAATVNGVCMVLLGVMVRWPFGPEWLVPAVILVFCFIFNFGGGMIPYVLLAEVFVPEVKGFSQSIMMLWLYIVNFILLLVFVPAVEFIGLQIVFFVFAGCAFACTLCTYYMIPETKGMNPYAIEEMFAMRIKDGRQWARPITEKK